MEKVGGYLELHAEAEGDRDGRRRASQRGLERQPRCVHLLSGVWFRFLVLSFGFWGLEFWVWGSENGGLDLWVTTPIGVQGLRLRV